MAGQIIQLTETLAAVREEMHGMHAEIHRLQRGEGGWLPEDRREREEELVDKKLFLPEPFTPSSIFREWKLEFEDYIAGRDKTLSDLLEKSEESREVIVYVGESKKDIDRAQKLYRIIRKLATHPEAKSIVTHVQHNNSWEAWRLLVARLDPKNDAFNAKSVRDLINVKVWKAKAMHELPARIAEWEHAQGEHQLRTGDDVLTDALRKDMLMNMITPELRAQVGSATLLVEDADLYHQKLKRLVTKYVYSQLPPSNIHGKDAHADNNNGNEQVDALAKGPRRDAKVGGGKGAPTGGDGDGKGSAEPTASAGSAATNDWQTSLAMIERACHRRRLT